MLAQRCIFEPLNHQLDFWMEFTISQIAMLIEGEVEGDGDKKIKTISSIEDGKEGSISFLSNPRYEAHLYETHASAVIVNKDLSLKKEVDTTLIRVKDAYASFSTLLQEYQKILSFSKSGIEKPSFLGEGSTYGEKFYLGAFSYIGENVIIGDNVKIHPNSFVGDNTEIGNNTIIHSGVKIYANTKIGSYCTLHSGAVIGSDGFGFAPREDGTYQSIPQVGNVVLEDHVDIGANTVVDCATFDSTIIKNGVKLDNLIQIGHNVEIGENTVIAGQAGVAGSSKIGKSCVIGGQVGIAGHLHIADKTRIQAQSGINRNTKEGVAIYGTPAIEYNNYLRSYSVFRKLPTVLKQIEALEEKIINLTNSKDQK